MRTSVGPTHGDGSGGNALRPFGDQGDMRNVLALSVSLLAWPLGAQSATVATLTLGAAESVFPEPFSSVSGFRALRDGRVLLGDAREKQIHLLDFRSGVARPVGREGSGPGEFKSLTRFVGLPGDTTVMEDPANGRFLTILPDGRPGATFTAPPGVALTMGGLVGSDREGRLLFESTRARPAGSGPANQVDLVRWDRQRARLDTLTMLARPQDEVTAARVLSGGRIQLATNRPLAPRDVVAQGGPAEPAVVRAAPYRVDRVRTDGRPVAGPPASAPSVRVTSAEQEAFVRGQVRSGAIVVSGGAPVSNSSGSAGGGARVVESPQDMMTPDMVWPTHKPPFTGAALAAEDGSVWVLRSRAHDDAIPVYDVFDASGRVTQRVRLAAATRLVGVTATHLYVVRTDADELQHLERHLRPRAP